MPSRQHLPLSAALLLQTSSAIALAAHDVANVHALGQHDAEVLEDTAYPCMPHSTGPPRYAQMSTSAFTAAQ